MFRAKRGVVALVLVDVFLCLLLLMKFVDERCVLKEEDVKFVGGVHSLKYRRVISAHSSEVGGLGREFWWIEGKDGICETARKEGERVRDYGNFCFVGPYSSPEQALGVLGKLMLVSGKDEGVIFSGRGVSEEGKSSGKDGGAG